MAYSSLATDTLMANPVFRPCPPQHLVRLLAHVHEKRLKTGDSLQVCGEPAIATFLVLEGAFELTDGIRQAITKNGLLGEEAAIGMTNYSATAVATKPSSVLVLPRDAMVNLAAMGPVRDRLLASYSNRSADKHTVADDRTLEPTTNQRPVPWGEIVGWILAIVVPIGILLWFKHPQDIPNLQAHYLLAILSAAIVMWIFGLLPDFIPALFTVMCVILLGLAPPQTVLGGFASDTFFMALSVLAISVVISTSGLSYRILLWLLRTGPAHKAWYNISLFLTGTVLTPVVPTTNGRVAILAPMFNDLLSAMGREAAQAEGPRLTASLMGGVSLLTAIFLSSKSVNFLIFGMLPIQERVRFQWLFWLYAASICGIVLAALYGLGVWLLFSNRSRPLIPRQLVADQLKMLGALSIGEWAAILGLLVLLISFLTSTLHHIDVPWVALAIMFSLLLFQFLPPREFREQIDWNFLIFLGALIGLVATINYVGLDRWFTDKLTWLRYLMARDFNLFVLMLAAVIFLVRLALPINATVVIFATLLVPTAAQVGVNPWVVGFIILMLSENFIWPYQASYYSQFSSMALPEAATNSPRLAILNALGFGMKLTAIYAAFPFWRTLGLI